MHTELQRQGVSLPTLHRMSQKRLVYTCTRSSNPQYLDLNRLSDTTKYNSAVCNVAHYQDFPNRGETPIRTPRSQQKTGTRRPDRTYKHQYVTSLLSTETLVGSETKKVLAQLAMRTPLRIQTAGPSIKSFGGSTRCGDVLNDFHVRETNPGYARNELGGFFMR